MSASASPNLPRNPTGALYIKLGRGNQWARESLLGDEQAVRLGYHEVPTDVALVKDWDKAYAIQLERRQGDEGAAKRDLTQIKHFFEAPDTVLWITFFERALWWCFSEPRVSPAPGGHSRPVIGKWSNSDIHGKRLDVITLSGRLTAIQGFQGTIATVRESDYLVSRLRGELPEEVKEATDRLEALRGSVEQLIQRLHPHDFEIFVDLLFRAAGYHRQSELGKQMKDIDLDLLAPLTKERFAVQVKSKAGRREFDALSEAFLDPQGYRQIFLAVHTAKGDLPETKPDDFVRSLGRVELAELGMRYGLIEWLIDRAS